MHSSPFKQGSGLQLSISCVSQIDNLFKYVAGHHSVHYKFLQIAVYITIDWLLIYYIPLTLDLTHFKFYSFELSSYLFYTDQYNFMNFVVGNCQKYLCLVQLILSPTIFTSCSKISCSTVTHVFIVPPTGFIFACSTI